jgi:hypothetical protein
MNPEIYREAWQFVFNQLNDDEKDIVRKATRDGKGVLESDKVVRDFVARVIEVAEN